MFRPWPTIARFSRSFSIWCRDMSFEALAKRHHKGRRLRSMTRWNQFVAMAVGQLAGRSSLRDIVSNLSAQGRKLYHLGVGAVARSSLARVNGAQPHGLYEELFGRLLARCRTAAPGHGFRFRNPLYSLDATTIDLCLSVFPWAKFRRAKGAVKLHLGLDHAGLLPAFARVTDGKTADIEAARSLRLPAGSIVAADRAYLDFDWINALISQGVFLVTRLKRRIKFKVVERRPANRAQGVTSDQTIVFTSARGRKRCPHRLRRIGYRDPDTGRHYVFLTTNFALSAKTIADIYKARWQVELFFKWIKQNLKIKSFVGTSRNAVMTQIWIALCVPPAALVHQVREPAGLEPAGNPARAADEPVRPPAHSRRARAEFRPTRRPMATSTGVRMRKFMGQQCNELDQSVIGGVPHSNIVIP